MELILFGLSTAFGIAAYVVYFQDARRSTIRPNRWSWLIWAFTTVVEVATFQAVSGDFATSAVFYISAIACAVITILIWHKSRWERPTGIEIFCVLLNVVAVVTWLGFHEEWWAHVIALVAIPLSFIPTYVHAWKDWSRENSPSWVLWTVGDVLALIYVATRMQSLEELPYAGIEALSHATMWIIVSWRARGVEMHRLRETQRWLSKASSALFLVTITLVFGFFSVSTLVGKYASLKVWALAGVCISIFGLLQSMRLVKRLFLVRKKK